MEDSSSSYSSESEDAEAIVFSYLKNRCYIYQQEDNILPATTLDRREAEVQAIINSDTSGNSVISFSSCSPDINLAEQQINAFKIWLTEMKDEICQKEVYQIIMPMLCHVYLDCLRTNLAACMKFLKRHAREPLLTKSWRPLVQDLLTLQSLSDIEKMPVIKTFRSCKSEIRLSTSTLIALRKFLTRKKCTLLLQVLRSRFKVETLTSEGNFVPEEEVVYSPSILKYSKQPNVGNNIPEEQKRVEKQNKVRKKRRKKSESVFENGEVDFDGDEADSCNNEQTSRLSPTYERFPPNARFRNIGRVGIETTKVTNLFKAEICKVASANGILTHDNGISDSENDRLSLDDECKLPFSKDFSERDDLLMDGEQLEGENKVILVPDDSELDELVSEIMRMRLRPTPPPPLLLYTAHKTDGVVCGEVCSTGKFAATGDHRSELRVWCLSETKHNPQLHPSYFSSVNIQAPSETSNDVQSVNSKQWWSLRGHCDTVYDCAFTPNSDYLVSVSFDTTMRLWNLHDYSCTAIYRGHTKPVWGVSISPVHNMVATSSSDKTARLWSLDRTYPVRILAGHTFDVMCCEFHPNGLYCATGGVDRTVRLWSVRDGTMVRAMGQMPRQDFVECLTFSPNGQYLASAGGDSWVWVWDLAGGELLYRLESPASRITSLAWATDGSTIAASTHDGAVYLWHLDNPSRGSRNSEYVEQIYSREEPNVPRRYTTKCSTVLSVQYSTKNSLVAVGLA